MKLFDELPVYEYEKVRDSFAWAFFSKKMNYTTSQVYDHPEVPESMNDPPSLEPKL